MTPLHIQLLIHITCTNEPLEKCAPDSQQRRKFISELHAKDLICSCWKKVHGWQPTVRGQKFVKEICALKFLEGPEPKRPRVEFLLLNNTTGIHHRFDSANDATIFMWGKRLEEWDTFTRFTVPRSSALDQYEKALEKIQDLDLLT